MVRIFVAAIDTGNWCLISIGAYLMECAMKGETE